MTIQTLTGDNGLLQKARSTVDSYNEEEVCEQIKLVYQEYQISQFTNLMSIEDELKKIYGNDNVSKVTLSKEKLMATIDEKVYIYHIDTGVAKKYVDPFNYGEYTKSTIPAGQDIILGTEKFMVISNKNGTIMAMPYDNITLTTDNPVQSSSAGTTEFSTIPYWSIDEDGNEINGWIDKINMDNNENNIQQYIKAYQKTLENFGAEGIEVRAAKRSEIITSEVTATMRHPGPSGRFWLGSVRDNDVWIVNGDGSLSTSSYTNNYNVRPIIIIE